MYNILVCDDEKDMQLGGKFGLLSEKAAALFVIPKKSNGNGYYLPCRRGSG